MMKEKNIERASNQGQGKTIRFHSVIIQVALLDVIFSLDSVMTAVGITPHFWVMALAITGAIIVMIFASEPVSSFIMNNPTVKMLALSYLMLIAMVLVADGFSCPIPRGYIYFSMGFSLGVETLNLMRCARYKRDQFAKKG
jgi:predicted tellurium resistance membrane protein TerC